MEDEKEIAKYIQNMIASINEYCRSYNLKLDVDTIEVGNTSKGNWTELKVKIYKEL